MRVRKITGGGIIEALEANTIATPTTNGSHNIYISVTSPFSLEDDEPSKVIGFINCKTDAECRKIQDEIQKQVLTVGYLDCTQIKGFSPL